jgi:hypothetical protein
MNITVNRMWITPNSTCGKMDIDGVFFCYTLEPAKPIPIGTYPVTMQESPHFTALMAESEDMARAFSDLFPSSHVITPHVQDVPGFTEIEIHPGNYPKDTHGCCLVGEGHQDDMVTFSDAAFHSLIVRIGNEPGKISITYLDPPVIKSGA